MPVLAVTAGGVTMEFTASELLARADAGRLAVSRDPSYGGAMSYQGVPLRALLAALPPDSADTIQARAKDGFVAEIPRALISGAAVPWIAIENASHPWPPLRGKAISAGPFYLGLARSRTCVDITRAVGLRINRADGGALSSAALARNCCRSNYSRERPCTAWTAGLHRQLPALPSSRWGRRGNGWARLAAAHAGNRILNRSRVARSDPDPAAVRHWPAQQMPGFNESALSGSDLGAIIDYLQYLAARPK
jgi:hypothetical protein